MKNLVDIENTVKNERLIIFYGIWASIKVLIDLKRDTRIKFMQNMHVSVFTL